MKHIILLSLATVLIGGNLASSSSAVPLKSFAPPPLITPNIAQNYMVENQFDNTDRQNYFFVTNLLDKSKKPWHISTGAYGKSFYNSALFKYRDKDGYAIVNLNHTKANPYKDGSGKMVDFGYERFNQGVILGILPSELSEIRLTLLHDNIKDDKQPHFQMDAVNTDRLVGKLNLRVGESDLSNTLNYELIYKNVKREANNFELRKADPSKQVFMDINREIYEHSLSYDGDFGDFHNVFGLGFIYDNHNGKRFMRAEFGDVLNGYRFGDVTNKTYRIFDTLSYNFSDFHKFSFGIEYSYNDVSVGKFNANLAKPAQLGGGIFPNANMLWRKYYGVDFGGNVDSEIVNLRLKYDFTPNELSIYSAEIARIGRYGDNIERFTTLFGEKGGGFISNPKLRPEYHNYIKFGFDLKNSHYKGYLNSLGADGFSVGGYLMADKVENLIILDRARGQNGVRANDLNVISRNVDALILSSHIYTKYNFSQNYALNLRLYYTYGQNESDNKPLYQIRPFEANLAFDHMDYVSFGSYNVGMAFRYMGEQNRGDFDKKTGLGIDLKEASKEVFTTDIYAAMEFKNSVGLRFGVSNIFDKKYTEFISGAHVVAVSPTYIMAPGRTFWLSVHANF